MQKEMGLFDICFTLLSIEELKLLLSFVLCTEKGLVIEKIALKWFICFEEGKFTLTGSMF